VERCPHSRHWSRSHNLHWVLGCDTIFLFYPNLSPFHSSQMDTCCHFRHTKMHHTSLMRTCERELFDDIKHYQPDHMKRKIFQMSTWHGTIPRSSKIKARLINQRIQVLFCLYYNDTSLFVLKWIVSATRWTLLYMVSTWTL
jgi:hypothetical protein